MTVNYSLSNMVGSVHVTQVDADRTGLYRRGMKRLFDVSLVLMTAPFTMPVVMLLAFFVWLGGGERPFYRQKRVGQSGRIFTLIKLRTMVSDADQRLAHYLTENPEAEREWLSTQKLRNDPRVTMLGRFLRKSSLDELPQLWNVLVGDMSLVGPRPMLPEQRPLYPGKAYFELRPGITGFWQISDRNACSFACRADFDNRYEENLSFTTDMAVLLRTVTVVIRGTGC